jgi:hypothetical protein
MKISGIPLLSVSYLLILALYEVGMGYLMLIILVLLN